MQEHLEDDDRRFGAQRSRFRPASPVVRPASPVVRRPRLNLNLTVASILAFLAGCGGITRGAGPAAIAIMPGVVNRTDNKSLRFALLKYGLDEFCKEMLGRGAPLKLADEQPAVGRFFPDRCESKIVDADANKSFVVQFSGWGYAYTNVTQRMGFSAGGLVEYSPDFLLDGSNMYIYFRTQRIASSTFQPAMVEGAGANVAMLLLPGGVSEKFGRELVSAELARGFTVLRSPDGRVDFSLGLLEAGKQPFHPYQVHGEGKAVLANERIEVHGGQREFLGPFEIDAEARALYVTMSVDGVPAVDLLVVPRETAEPWLGTYVRTAQTTPSPYPPVAEEVVPAGAPWRKPLRLTKGRYYVVIDNTATAGRVSPGGMGADDRAALVDFAVELGDAL